MISRADIISDGFSASENLTEEELLKWMAETIHLAKSNMLLLEYTSLHLILLR
jgi:hypothetical protein